jgi:hypothetical protein
VPQVPPAPVRAPATAGDPAPVHEADEDEAGAEGAGADEAAEDAADDDAEIVEGDDEAVLAEEALEAAAALRRPSFDEAQTRLCEQRLRELGAQFEVIEPIGEDEAHCGAPHGIALSSVAGIAVEPALTVRCEMGLAFAEWAGNVVAPMARLYLGDEPSVIGTSGSYECRWRRGGSDDAAFSQHAFANAIDVAGVSFADREALQIRPPEENSEEERLFQAAIRGGACAYFTTVLGPMTNEAHADHLHFDMAERRGGFRLCE